MGVDHAPTQRVIQLYSAECVALLKEAVEKEKLDLAAQPIQSIYHQPFGIGASTSDADGADDADTDTHGSINSNDKDNSSSSSSSSNEEEEEEEQSSTDSEEDQEEQHDKVMPLNESSSSSTNTNTKTTAIKPIKTQKAKSQITATQKQRDALLRQLGTPPCRPFATSSKTILSIPSALLLPTSTTPPSQAAYELATNLGTQPVMVVLLRSGRLAAAVFSMNTCLAHRASTRYTIRKGQGKAQSTQDGNRRAKSIGSQLRRQGELALREDVVQLFADWTKAAYTTNAGLILISLPKTMKKEFFQDCGLDREDPRLRTIPLDTGRPTFDTVVAVHEIMMRVTVGDKTTMVEDERIPTTVLLDDQSVTEALLPPSKQHKQKQQQPTLPTPKIEEPIVPLSPLHELARDGNLSQLIAMLQQHTPDDIGTRAGIDLMTPLHYAASNEHDDSTRAAACVTALLLDGHADPCMVDARHRVPYFLATHDKVRDAFRMARATLGEDYCDWEHGAKVGPALTNDDVVTKKIKAADKKKRQKARQKESKAKEQAAAQEAERQRQEQQELKNKEEDAKRIRAGLQPKSTAATNICDFCQTTCRGKRRNQMLQRLEYAYCSTDCVAKHKRELMAAAALARFGN